VDDGDGIHILPVTVRLPLVNVNPASTTTPTTQSLAETQAQAHTQTQTPTQRHFIPAKERKALRKIAFLESQLASQSQSQSQMQKKPMIVKKEKEYQRNDVRVGDTIRVKGRIEEYKRGNGEWVRQVVVEPGSGGFIGMSYRLYGEVDWADDQR
jgi:hypothetical protein